MSERTTIPRCTVPDQRSTPPLAPERELGPTPERKPLHGMRGHGLGRRGLLAGVLVARSTVGADAPADAAPGPDSRAAGPSPFDPGAIADTELLRQCGRVRALEAAEIDGPDDRWSLALHRVSDLRPVTRAGLHAKTRLALSMLPFGSAASCSDWASPDERLIWSLLRNVLALSEPDTP